MLNLDLLSPLLGRQSHRSELDRSCSTLTRLASNAARQSKIFVPTTLTRQQVQSTSRTAHNCSYCTTTSTEPASAQTPILDLAEIRTAAGPSSTVQCPAGVVHRCRGYSLA